MPFLNPSSTPNPRAVERANNGEDCFRVQEVYSQFQIPVNYIQDQGLSFWTEVYHERTRPNGHQSFFDREESCKFFKDRPCNGKRYSLTISNFYYKEAEIFEYYDINDGLREKYLKDSQDPMAFPLELVLGFDELFQAQKVYVGSYHSGSGHAYALGQYANFVYNGLIYNKSYLNDFLGNDLATEIFKLINFTEYRYAGGIGRRMIDDEDGDYRTMILGVNGKASDKDLNPVDIPDLRLSKYADAIKEICRLLNCSSEGFDPIVEEHGDKWITYLAFSKDFFGGEDFSMSVYFKEFFNAQELPL